MRRRLLRLGLSLFLAVGGWTLRLPAAELAPPIVLTR